MKIPRYTINRVKRVKLSNNDWEVLWKKLPDYIELLNEQQKIAEIMQDADETIKLIYIEMPYSKNFCSSAAFLHLVFLDGTFCTDQQRSTIIAAVAMTSGETKENYEYFLKKLSEIISDSDQLTFIADQHPSIKSSVQFIFPLSCFIPCAWHVSKHLHCPSIVLFELLRSDHPLLFNIRLEDFKKYYPHSANKISSIISSMSYTGSNVSKLGYITSSPIESFNSAILDLRDKEPLIFLDGILRWSLKQCSEQIIKLGNNIFCKTAKEKIGKTFSQ